MHSPQDEVRFNRSAFLITAEKIARRIAADAIWYAGRCNWMGAEPLERTNPDEMPTLTYRSLGPDLYSGTSGVALFLAELYGIVQEAWIHSLALGAIRHALSRSEGIPPSLRLGYLTGCTGIALAAVRVAMILGESAVLTEGKTLLRQAISEIGEAREFDLMSGKAGAIAALIVLNAILDDPSLLDRAVRMGNELLKTAEKSIGYSWPSPALRSEHNLTGFSHGAAGVAYALLELFHATGVATYREGSAKAMQYERHWFDAAAENWPDFRADPYSARSRRRSQWPSLTFWCHGAPGIALSRLRAYEILQDDACKAEAIVALRTTATSIEAAIDACTGNCSMCHGILGNAEALSYGANVIGSEEAQFEGLAIKAAVYAADRYSARGTWPCGTRTAQTPNFMLGLAGIGHHYLRLFQPTIPSLLILRKECWAPRRGL